MTAQSPDASVDTGQTNEQSDSGGRSSGKWRKRGSTALGGMLMLRGLRRRGVRGTLMAGAGAAMLYRGLTGKRASETIRGAAGNTGPAQTGASEDAMEVVQSITVDAEPEELYERWGEPETQEQIMAHFADVRSTGEDRQHWTVGGPMGMSREWESQIVEDRPGEFLRWESLPGAELPNEGSVRFREAPGDQGTEVTLRFQFEPPGGSIGKAAMEKMGLIPEKMASQSLHRFKSLVETGEIPTLEGNPSGRGKGDVV